MGHLFFTRRMDPEFIQHLQQLNQPDANVRQKAEDLKNHQIATNLAPYLLNLAKAISTDGVDEGSKQMAGVIIKNAISGRSAATRRQHQQQWLNIASNTRTEVKQVLFNGLSSSNTLARRGASSAIASIAVAEFPCGEWPNLVPTLTGAINQSNNPAAQEGALLTLSLICEDIDPSLEHNLENHSNEILNSIVMGANAQAPIEVRRASIKAMYGALNIVSRNFEVKDQRDYIMTIICDACKEQDENIQIEALNCLVRTAEIYYDQLDRSYMSHIWDLTSKIMVTDSKAAPFTIEFWSSIAETEKIISESAEENEEPEPNFSKQILPMLVPLLCQNLLKQVDSTDEADEWTIAAAAAACITILAECTGDDIVPVIAPFIQKINDSNWRQREASTLAFGSIAFGPESDDMKKMIEQGMTTLLNHVANDQHPCVRATSAWTISRVADFHPDIVEKDVIGVMRVLVNALSQEDPVIASYACFGLLNILNNIYDNRQDENTNELSDLFLPLCQELIKAGDRDDADMGELRITVYETITTLIEVAPEDCCEKAQSMIVPFLQKLETTFSPNMDLEDQHQLQAYIPLVLQTITQRIGAKVQPFAEQMYKQFIAIFEHRKMIVDESMNAISALFSVMPGVIQIVISSFTPYLLGAIKNASDVSVLKSGLLCFGSICDSMGPRIYQIGENGAFCNAILGHLISHLQNPEVDRELRPLIITTFGEVALAVRGLFVNYYPHIMNILSAASDITISNDADDDTIDYVIALRESILEAYPAIIVAMSDGNEAKQVIPSLGKMLPFMETLWNQPQYRTGTIISSMIGIVNDILDFLVPHMETEAKHHVLRMQFLVDLITHGMKSPNVNTREASCWAKDRLTAAHR